MDNQSMQVTTPATKENSTLDFVLNAFPFFAGLSLIYGIFFCICIYKNFSGITSAFLAAGTLGYCLLIFRKLHIPLKKDAWFYMSGIQLCGISDFMTDSAILILLNDACMLFLLYCFLLHHFFNDENWNPFTYFGAILVTFFGPFCSITLPFKSFSLYLTEKKTQKNTKFWYVVLGVFFSIPMLIVIVALLSSADAVFRNLTGYLFQDLFRFDNLFGILFTIAIGTFFSYGTILFLGGKNIATETDSRTQEPVTAITFTSILSVIYLVFCLIQITGLFLGRLTLPAEYTYAKYAREGFFQLLFVCMINLFLVLFCLRIFRPHRVLSWLLSLISVCTYIMTVSSAMRMILYIQSYSLTFLRVFVLFALLVIFLIMTGILIYIYHPGFPLFRYCLYTVTVLYLVLSFSKPDYLIATYNLSQYNREEILEVPDYFYIENLSLDAFSAVIKYGDDASFSSSYMSAAWEKTEDMNFRNFNISRYRVRQILIDQYQ